MKLNLTILIILIANICFAQDFYSEFADAYHSGDTTKQIEILIKWEKEQPNNPQLFTSRFNYHFNKSRQEVLEIRTDVPQEDGLVIEDSLGNTAGFLGSRILYDQVEVDNAIKYINKGIEKHPTRLDMRFGKTYLYGQLEDWDNFTDEIIKTINYSATKSTPWLWSNDEVKEGDNEFMLASMQDYQLQLYDTQDDNLLKNMRKIAKAILEVYPNHVESLSNLSITYLIFEEFDKALEPLIKAESINPEDHIVLANIANTYKKLENKEKSIEYYKKLLKFKEDGIAEFAQKEIDLLSKE